MSIYNRPDSTSDMRRLGIAFVVALSFALLLWLVKLVEYLIGLDFTHLGIYPRRLDGLVGVLCAPLIHGSFAHLFANTAPMIVIGTTLIYAYPHAARVLLPVVYLGSGVAVWLFAREAYHIGASGLVFGMLLFVLTLGIVRWERPAIALALVVSFLYGGLIWGVLPVSRDISFESHLSGALIGIVMAFLFKHHDPAPPPRQYSWENEEAEADDSDWLDRL